MAEAINTLVIGAGIVGLAVARALARGGREVVVIERHDAVGTETSSRNSEVIHAGIYYPAGSLKARLCVAGKHALYDYLERRQIAHRRIGKLIVAVADDQRDRLEALRRQAIGNGVDDLVMLDGPRTRELEPALRAVAALYSPSTGILDSHGLVTALRRDVEDAGGQLALRTTFEQARGEDPRGARLRLGGPGVATDAVAREIVNCAGLQAVAVARDLDSALSLPGAGYAKGNYFYYRGACPFAHLIYPLPVAGGLGVHATLDLAGRLRFGPDVEWIEAVDYAVDPKRAPDSAAAIRAYWPGVVADRLEPAYAGVRPKILRNGQPLTDFEILLERRDRSTLVHLLGIESPGLTASLAIGDYVRGLLDASG